MALHTLTSTPAACKSQPSGLFASCNIGIRRRSTLAAPATADAVFTVPCRAFATVAFAPDFRVADDALMNCDEQKRGFCASASASFDGTDDSDLMSAPVDLPREEAEVFFSEEKLHQDEAAPGGANVENPAERASEGQQQGGQAEQRSSGGSREPEGGRFDEEAVPGDHPYSPKPKDRGHGIPPHKDDTNTGPGPMSSNPTEGGGSSSSGEQHPSGDEHHPAAAI